MVFEEVSKLVENTGTLVLLGGGAFLLSQKQNISQVGGAVLLGLGALNYLGVENFWTPSPSPAPPPSPSDTQEKLRRAFDEVFKIEPPQNATEWVDRTVYGPGYSLTQITQAIDKAFIESNPSLAPYYEFTQELKPEGWEWLLGPLAPVKGVYDYFWGD